jgi:multidrug efflux pump
MVTYQPFGIVMVGLGIIALAGIVVNNNIVLIDTYNRIRQDEGLSPVEAALETGSLRLRPVFLTAITTVLGLMPMVLSLNINLIERHVAYGAPSTQWWTQLSSAIAGGLTFATVLTLVLTPCMLVLGERKWISWSAMSRFLQDATIKKPVLVKRKSEG